MRRAGEVTGVLYSGGEGGGRKNADMLADRRGSAKAGFAVGHHEICDFLTRVKIENQPGQSC